ncbi:PAS domain S-box protein [Caulobacter endophyticus]|uniref:histidine kinase n=1 Tax=Caulobacter endophyticus TaxID=2172652 RepID=A0A2T9JZI5_9CAUL|nr:PAS domain S-box protein [Caulobacter endophyticus]PVM89136.1 hybrid sensor histidine kinase/response regulator [Caulobacter endophyticus]
MSSPPSPDTPPAPLSQAESAQWFFENAHDLFAVVVEGRFVTVNPAWTRLTGWTAADLIGQSPLKFVDPEDHPSLLEGGKVIQGMGGAVFRVRMICNDGRRVWLEAHARLGPAGELVGTLRDVSAEVARKAEQAVSRRTREMLASAAGVGVWSFDPVAQRIEWSSDILSLTGLRPEEVSTPEAFYARLDEPERGRVRATFSRAVRTGQGGTIEHHMRGATGQKFAFRATFQTEPRPGGVFALRGISQNITDVARDRDLARWGEEKARKLVEGAPFAVALYDRDLRLTVVSPRFLDIFQATEAEVIGKSLQELTYGARKRFVAAVERALTGQTVVRREDSLTDGHGREHRLRWEARPWRDASGAIAGVITYMDDVTALTEARREARANARRLKTALGAAQAGVYEIDHAEKTFWGSPEFHRILGQRITFDDVRQAIWPMIRSEDVAAVYAAGAVGRWGERAFDARVMRPNGEERWIRLFHEIRRDPSGRVRKAYGLVLDIDEQKRAELALVEAERAAQAANEAKAQFLANMSHEIRTPMNGVLGVIHLLKRQGLSSEADHLLGEALACGRMLSTLLDDIIDFSRIEAGRLEVAPEPIDPAELAHSVARLLRAQAEHKGLALIVEAPDHGIVLADPTRLRQALFNLIGNAVKFTLSGSVALRLRRGEGDRLVFEVSDTGVGIAPEAQARLFQRFQQADASTTRRFGGSGLGLAITRRLAQMMGGEVEFSSVEGEGSTFSLSISAPPVQTVPRDEADGDKMLEGLKVLVVEDNSTNRMVARRILEMLGADVETAEDGLSGVEAATRGFDLILMDVQMPGVDGLEAARRIRALPGPVGATPIVALTANVLAHQRATYLAAGMNGVAAKPISPTALLAEIVRVAEAASTAETEAA